MQGINAGTIIDKTMFLRVRFNIMGNTRKVKSGEILTTDADKKFLKVQKTLLDSKELVAIRAADTQMRQYLYNMCLPYDDMGIMILPLDLLDTVSERLKAYQDERGDMVKAFVEAYPVLCQQAAENLGSLYNPLDYPDVSEVAGKFSFDWQYMTFMTPESLKTAGMYEEEKQKAVEKMQQAAEQITLMLRETIYELVNHLKEALEPDATGKPKRLFASSVTNIQDFIDTFKARNVTNDEQLENLIGELKTVIHPGFNVDVLRKDDQFKKDIHTNMEEITKKLALLTEEVPGRKFRKD